MAGGVNRKISAASARAHTRRAKDKSSLNLPSGILSKLIVVLLAGLVAWGYQSIQPPQPKLCGSPDGPAITAPRIKLSDGRHLAYKEAGVPKDKARYKIVFVHGLDSCRHDNVLAKTLSLEVVEELGIYLVSFDRPGYGESDPNPKSTVKSIALDIEALADKLELGSKFYVVGFSMGGQVVWSCLNYIPNRLAGAALIAPVVNYWWVGLPSNLSTEAYNQQHRRDQWAVGVAHYAPWLTYWWNTQKWFPSSSPIAQSPDILPPEDKALMHKLSNRKEYAAQVRQQGEYESVLRDLNLGFSTWEFSPVDLKNPFPENEGSVHLWHGVKDMIVPVSLQQFIAGKLPWIYYHELPEAGHMFPHADGMSDSIVKSLLSGEK